MSESSRTLAREAPRTRVFASQRSCRPWGELPRSRDAEGASARERVKLSGTRDSGLDDPGRRPRAARRTGTRPRDDTADRTKAASPSMKETPLHDLHASLGAKLVEFGGWHMPAQYGPILDQGPNLRTHARLLELSH